MRAAGCKLLSEKPEGVFRQSQNALPVWGELFVQEIYFARVVLAPLNLYRYRPRKATANRTPTTTAMG